MHLVILVHIFFDRYSTKICKPHRYQINCDLDPKAKCPGIIQADLTDTKFKVLNQMYAKYDISPDAAIFSSCYV